MRKGLKRLTALALSIIIAMQGCLSGYAKESSLTETISEENLMNIATSDYDDTGSKKDASIVRELTEKRDEYTKHFLMDDGTVMAASYKEKVHRLVKGVYEDISTSWETGLFEGTEVLYNRGPVLDLKFAKKSAGNKLYSFEAGGHKVKVSLANAKKTDAIKTSYESTAQESGIDERLIIKNKIGVVYKDILKSTDISYMTNGEYLKENIVLKEDNAPDRFTFEYKIPGLDYRLENDGSIILYASGDTSNICYRLSTPYMWDSQSKYSNNINVTAEKKGNTLYVTLRPDRAFLDDVDTIYPVTIDPPVTVTNGNGIDDTFISLSQPDNSLLGTYNLINVGNNEDYGVCRSYLRFNSLPQLNAGDYVTKAYINLWQYSFDAEGSQEFRMAAYNPTSSWDEDITWNTQTGYSEPVDYVSITPNEGEDGEYTIYQRNIDITRIVRDWYTSDNNNGVMLASLDESRNASATFLTSEYPVGELGETDELYPSGIIVYRNMNGIENYWSYHSQSTNFGATGMINDATGSLTIVSPDYACNGNRMPVSITRIYNSSQLYEEPDFGIKSGIGWRLNINASLIMDNINGKLCYIYTDGDGTRHYIVQDDGGAWKDEDGLGLKLDFYEGDYAITDKNASKARFVEHNGKIYLYAMEDANQNAITIHYDSGNYERPERISDGAGRITVLSYNGEGRIASITDPAGRITRYTYTGDSNRYLSRVINPDGTYTEYNYNYTEDSRIVNIGCSDGTFIEYGMNPAMKVVSVTAVGSDSQWRSVCSIEYVGANVLRYTYPDGLFEDYQSDDYGRITSILNSAGYAAYTGFTTNTATSGANNKASFVSNVQKSVSNLIFNGSAELDSNDWDYEGWQEYSGVESIRSNQYAKLGLYSWKVSKLSNGGYYHRRTSVEVQKNHTYTYSGYIRTDISANGNAGAKLYVLYYNSAGEAVIKESEPISETAGEWVRTSVTFTNESDCDSVFLFAGITSGASGTAYYDCLQLEDGSTPNRYNAIENGSFERGLKYVESGTGGVVDYISTDPPGEGDKAVRVYGNTYSTNVGVKQNAVLNVPANTNIVVSAYARATAAPMSDSMNLITNGHVTGNDRLFGIELEIYYTDGSMYRQIVKFNDSLDQTTWQYMSAPINLAYEGNKECDKTVSDIRVNPRYSGQINYADFDHIGLYVEEFGNEYSYDNDGQLISSAMLATQNQTYEYGDSNLKRIITNVGSRYEYAYDQHKNITDSTDTTGIRNIITYDSFGNPLTAVTQGEKRNEALVDGGIYYLENVKSGKLLETYNSVAWDGGEINQHSITKTVNQMWRIAKQNDGSYTLSPLNAPSKYLGTVNNSQSLGAGTAIYGTKQTTSYYRIERTDIGAYVIRLQADRNKVLDVWGAATGENVRIRLGNISGESGGTNQQWYFKSVPNSELSVTPVVGKSYYIYNKNSNKVVQVCSNNDTNGATITQYDNKKQSGMHWTLKDAGNGYVYFQSDCSSSGRVLGFDSSAINTSTKLLDNTGNALLQFKLQKNSDETYRILNRATNNYMGLAVSNADMGNDGVILEFPYDNAGPDRDWYFIPAQLDLKSETPKSGEVYYVKSAGTGMYMETTQISEGGRVRQNIFTGKNSQKFQVTVSGELVTLAPVENTEFIAGVGSESKITLTTSNDASNTRFKAIRQVNGAYKLKSVSSKSPGIIKIPEGNYDQGVMLLIAADGSEATGQWIFEKAGPYTVSSIQYSTDGNYVSNVTDNLGKTYAYNYDLIKGNLLSETAADGDVTSYTYTASNDRLKTVTQNNLTTSYEYNSSGAISTINTPGGSKYTLAYNGFGQSTIIKVGNRTLISNSYDNLGRLTSSMYGNNANISYEYDELSRVKSTNYGNAVTNYTYDNDGNLYKIEDGLSQTVTEYRYDSIKRLVSSKCSSGYRIDIRYDDKNRIKSIHENTGYGEKSATYGYDTSGYIKNVTTTYDNNEIESAYHFDGLNKITGRYLSINDDDASCTYYKYMPGKLPGSSTGVISSIENDNGDVTEYKYDNNLNITEIWYNDVIKASYTYDNMDRLTSETLNGETTYYSYDDSGNIISRQKANSTVLYTYGENQWKELLTSYNGHNIVYDTIGNPIAYRSQMGLTWKNGRRLASVITPDMSAIYQYNDDGIRTSKTVNGVKTDYYISDNIISALTRENDHLEFVYDEKSMVYGVYYNGTPYVYERNAQGDIIAIANAYGRVVNYEYDAWGKIVSVTGSLASSLGNINPFRYRGYIYDDETEFYYLMSRYYDPEVGRFINEDVYLLTGQGADGHNMFAYCGNNPVNRLDPTGNFLEEIFGFISAVGDAMGQMAPAYAGCGTAALADGPLPIGDIIGAVGCGVITIGVACKVAATDKNKSNEESKDKGKGGNDSSKKPTGQNQMQNKVEKGQAPKDIDRVDTPHVPRQQPHVHFKDGTSLNQDGTVHDVHNGIPNVTTKVRKWLINNGWKVNN